MAKKSTKSARGKDGNKSAAIRDYISTKPSDGPTAVADALNSANGWNISPAYVSTIKNKMKESRSGAKRARAGAAAGGNVDERALLQAKELAKQAGSIDQAKAALDLLGRLTN